MRITKVYTRTGDKGQTRLVGGQVVDKDDARIEAYGTVDELNAVVGMVRVSLRDAAPDVRARLDPQLDQIQNDLFNVGSDLATRAADRWDSMYRVGDADVDRLERWIDALNDDLPPLEEFILPGGGPAGSTLHLARTVCRRSERRVISLIRAEEDVGTGCMRYLNRLSDYLFVLGRWAARAMNEPETTWTNPNRPKGKPKTKGQPKSE